MAMLVKNVPVRHETYCRALVEEPRRAHPIIQAMLPEELAKLLDGYPELINTELVDDQLGSHRTDMQFLYKLKTGGQLIVILEHKSSREADTAWQMLRYQMVVCQSHVRSGKEGLPMIYLLVLHNGAQEWGENPDVKSLIKGNDEARGITGTQMAEPGFDAFDAKQLVPMLQEYPESQYGCAAMAAGGQRGKASVEELEALFRLLPDDSGFAKMTKLYIVTQHADNIDKVYTAMRKVKGERGVKVMEEYGIEVLDQAVARGRTEGEAMGRVEGEARLLTNLLKLKFGDVSADAEGRIRQASPEELDAWAGAILTASSPAEVFSTKPQ